MRVGGRAEWLLEPDHPDQLVAAYCEARERGLPVRVLGGGANLIITEDVLPGVVIATERMNRFFRPMSSAEAPAGAAPGDAVRADPELPLTEHLENDEPYLVAWAGAPMPGLVRAARELGWAGLAGLVGVPGHIGGGVAMNAGGRWGELWDVVERVRLLLPDGTVVERLRADCTPGYRDAALGDVLVLGVVLGLEVGDRETIREQMRTYLQEKSAAQPVTERSSGCIFRNPDPEQSDGRSAGKLIEDCGGKGLERGGAIVSPKHGNFIVNRGTATAVDVLALVEDVRDLVREKSGVELVREVRLWSASDAPSGFRGV